MDVEEDIVGLSVPFVAGIAAGASLLPATAALGKFSKSTSKGGFILFYEHLCPIVPLFPLCVAKYRIDPVSFQD